jgi:hypothetical protein
MNLKARGEKMSKRNYIIAVVLIVCVVAGAVINAKVKFDNRHDREGLYILRGEDGHWFEVIDDLYASESDRLLWGIAMPKLKRAKGSGACTPTDKPCTVFEWNEEAARGFIKTLYPNGKKLIFAMGRSISSNGLPISGLFLGGGLPPSDPDFQASNNNETGVTYFDGNRYFHIWCNVNEGIQDEAGKHLLPSTWTFVSSKILENSAHDITIKCKHRTVVNNVPITIERTLFYQTGDSFITLTTKLTNVGSRPTYFMYIYGDEPWIGNYYTFSKGNIGWYKDGLVMTEMKIDTAKYNYVGMFDYGNPLAGESHSFTGKANFLEWEPSGRPDLAYFSNEFGKIAEPEQKVPLSSYNNRVVSLQWGPSNLTPGQSLSFNLKVGMADNDPRTGLPVKPDTQMY